VLKKKPNKTTNNHPKFLARICCYRKKKKKANFLKSVFLEKMFFVQITELLKKIIYVWVCLLARSKRIK